MINTTKNEQIGKMSVSIISVADAKKMVVENHYMHTAPQDARIAYGVFMDGKCYGCMIFGHAPTTGRKLNKFCSNIQKTQYIELQRTWVSDKLGHNTESWMMAQAMKSLKKAGIWIVLTHSGGCKDDVGFIFQASGWLYFGGEPCNDFFLTKTKEYKNIVSAVRFGRVPKDVLKKGNQLIGEYLFGEGCIINARRHLYLYPINKNIRRRLEKISLPYPKDPAALRYNQEWVG